MRLTEVTATLTSSSGNIQHSQIFLKNAHCCSRRSLFKRRKGFLRDHALTDLRLGLGFNHRSWSLSSHVLTLKLGQNHADSFANFEVLKCIEDFQIPALVNRETPSEQWTHMPYRTPMQHDPASQRNRASKTSEKTGKRESNALALLARFCNAECFSLAGLPIRKRINRKRINNSRKFKMNVARKQNSDTKHCNNPEARKGKQLTSIIDQLTINKTKDAVPNSKRKKKDAQTWLQLLKTDDLVLPSNLVSSCEGQQSSSWRQCEMPTDALASSSTGHNSNAPPKADRGTPDAESSSSPSISPHSPSPGRGFPTLLAPTFGGLRVNSVAPFSPPPGLERFSPATGNPAIKQMELMTRNYSDFMRCLAAKYNQNNNQESFSMPQSNGLMRGYDASFPYKGGSPFLIRNTDDGNGGGCLSTGINRKLDSQNSPNSSENRNNCNNINSSNTPLSSASCGISDFSSSQTLLNLVRTASAQSASQLENYLKGAVKRSADGENRLDPLDLTVGAVKRPKLDLCRDLFHTDTDATLTSAGDSNARTLSLAASKPAWMSLLDKRMQSQTSSSRTSPKIQITERSRCVSLCVEKSCSSQSEASDLSHWTVEDVVKFVSSVDTCSEYAERFREESIDGTTLPLLTEDHLTMHLGMKLGPALKLRSNLARRIGHCAVCMHCVHCHGEDSTDSRRHESSRSPTVSK
ncbi:sterile alpha motif domain-containing protein 11 [Trichonephila clavata]|uniref:Sterile alpha motif domain-containing protein 11 n=1 Tax=Trichonephila clavata TaxID=2740835 RepID=A0A8X6M6U2_TRICU|nr:sterile alpha motif domain-containing protein 11 [Trichonephila clavata]